MDEYITREAALEVVNGWREQLIPIYGGNDEYVKCLETVAEHLYFIPAADVRPVVLCRDCIHYEMGVCLKIYDDGSAAKEAWHKRKPDDFCSYGERREVQHDNWPSHSHRARARLRGAVRGAQYRKARQDRRRVFDRGVSHHWISDRDLVGNMRDFAASFYKSTAWKDCRAAYIKSVGGLCERCLARGLYVPGVIVHHKRHITPETINDPTVTLNPDNLELVCREHHADLHRGFERRWRVDEFGRIETKGD